MTINMTLVVQGINFFIAYVLLRRFLLKPVVQIITHEQAQEAALHSAIESRKAMVREQEYVMREKWLAFQNTFRGMLPALESERVFRHIKPQVQVPLPAPDTLATLTADIAQASVQKVQNVRW
jgi:hypothetical protein